MASTITQGLEKRTSAAEAVKAEACYGTAKPVPFVRWAKPGDVSPMFPSGFPTIF
jgi:hypothetical protein